jgi:hypothetical protein
MYFRQELTGDGAIRSLCRQKVAKPVIQATSADVWQCLWHVATRWASDLYISILLISASRFIIEIYSLNCSHIIEILSQDFVISEEFTRSFAKRIRKTPISHSKQYQKNVEFKFTKRPRADGWV